MKQKERGRWDERGRGGKLSGMKDGKGEGGKERERKDDMKGRGRITLKRKGEDCFLKRKGNTGGKLDEIEKNFL